MSGRKHATITISQDEYRRLHELDMKQRFSKIRDTNGDDSRYDALLDAYNSLEERQKEYESVIANMTEEMAVIETEQSYDILAVQTEYYQNLMNQYQELQEENLETKSALSQTTEYFKQAIHQEQTETQERINILLNQLTAIRNDDNLKEDHARLWIANCNQISDFINTSYDHDKFFPGEFDRILQRLNMAIINLKRGYIDPGLQFAQEAFLKFSELRISLEEKTSEWQASFQINCDELQRLYQDVTNSTVIPAMGIDGEDLGIDIEVNYWAHGQLSQLRKNINTIVSTLYNNKQEITFDDLNKLSTESIPKLKQLFSDVILVARQNAINSQIKINVAYYAMKAMEKHGFSLQDAQYNNGDMRGVFSAQLSDPDGSNIILQITPNNADNSNDLLIDTIDDTIHTEDEYMQRWEVIKRSIQECGIQVSPVQVMRPKKQSIKESSPLEIPVKKSKRNNQNHYYVQTHRPAITTNH
ncbi:MAG: hypothetical protein PVJ21_11160 [Anaerolineales bacterium]|jgi:hypothetical protein